MKKSNLFFLLILVSGFMFHRQVYAQGYHSNQAQVTILLIKPGTGEVIYTLTEGIEKILITPSGNFLRTVSFDIDPDHPIMNFSGPRRILEVTMRYDTDGDGVEEVITDTMAVLTRSGNLKFVFHVNGAGNRLPPGWDF